MASRSYFAPDDDSRFVARAIVAIVYRITLSILNDG